MSTARKAVVLVTMALGWFCVVLVAGAAGVRMTPVTAALFVAAGVLSGLVAGAFVTPVSSPTAKRAEREAQ